MVHVKSGVYLAPFISFPTCLFFLILSLIRQAHGESMCSMIDQRTAIVDDRLFFCSGNYTFDNENLFRHPEGLLYWVNLNDTLNVNGSLDMNLVSWTELPDDSLWGGRYPDWGGQAGAFFYDHEMLYPYGGLVGPSADLPTSTLWAFNTTTNVWNETDIGGGRLPFMNNSEGVYASDPRTGNSFYTGGWMAAIDGIHNGTIKFHTGNSDSNLDDPPSWDFKQPVDTIQGPNIVKGAMTYVRKGKAGVLVVFGGYQTAYLHEGLDPPYDKRDMSDIYIYDISMNTWHRQTATGDIPPPRTEFCAAVSSAPDDSSFQITIHGGWDQLQHQAYNDVFVLSVPSFRWIRVSDTENPDLRGVGKPGRNRHKCDMWNEASMIVTGGQITLGLGATTLLDNPCNQGYPLIKVLDTSTYRWQSEFNPQLTYSVPEVVTAVIGGNATGNAKIIRPELGWSSDELADIFSPDRTVPRDTYVPPGRSAVEDDSNPAPSPKKKDPSNQNGGSKELTRGEIAGIVVGGLTGVALSIVLAVFLFRRNRDRHYDTEKEGKVKEGRDPNRNSQGSQKSSKGTLMIRRITRVGSERRGRVRAREEDSNNNNSNGDAATAPCVTSLPIVRGWRKPELDASAERFELSAERRVCEVSGGEVATEVTGDDVSKRQQRRNRNNNNNRNRDNLSIGSGEATNTRQPSTHSSLVSSSFSSYR